MCSQLYMNSFTANKICRSLGYKIANGTYEYTYNGSDAAFDVINCDGISEDCVFTFHTQGQLCRSSKAIGLVCSIGKYICYGIVVCFGN